MLFPWHSFNSCASEEKAELLAQKEAAAELKLFSQQSNVCLFFFRLGEETYQSNSHFANVSRVHIVERFLLGI